MKRRPDKFIPRLIPALVMGIVPHLPLLKPWIIASCVISWTYLLLSHRKNWPLPSRWLIAVFTLTAFIGIFSQTKGIYDSDSAAGLLCLSAALKPLEIKSHRDRMITLFLAYFMVVAALFFSSSFEMTVYLYLSVIGITCCLILVNHYDIKPDRGLKLAFSIGIQALPLSLILFVVFPRVQGGFWGISSVGQDLKGLSDTLTPGVMSDMRLDNRTALGISFDGSVPAMNDRYFRARVFQVFDGVSWKITSRVPESVSYHKESDGWSYTVILEPHHQHYAVTMDFPGAPPAGFNMAGDFTVRSWTRVIRPVRYSMKSFPETGSASFRNWEKIYMDLPDYGNPETRALAAKLRNESGSVIKFIEEISVYFRDQPFYYTLNPPLPVSSDVIDDFLFRSRKGYCEHYASAFVFMMRVAGVPARIVGGYYGGEINPLGDFLVLRQKDAHAWAEVFIENRGWIRIDPTTFVNSSRVEKTAVLNDSDASGIYEYSNFGVVEEIVKRLRWVRDAVNYQWYTKVISYSDISQKHFLKSLGLSTDRFIDLIKTVFIALVVIAAVMFFYYILLDSKQDKEKDQILKIYEKFLEKLRKVGIDCPPSSGPVDIANMASLKRKDIEKEIRGITALYVLLRYGGKHDDVFLAEDFRKQVERFKPSKPRLNVQSQNK